MHGHVWFEPEQHPDEGCEITFVVCTLIERLLIPGLVDPLSPKSDLREISPNYINTKSREKVVRINKMII